MTDAPTGEKTLLRMTRFTVLGDGTIAIDTPFEFTVMINPAEFKHSFGIAYDKKKTQGQAAANPRFAAFDADRVDFSIVLDGTGVVPTAASTPPPDVTTQVRNLNKVVYRYIGTRHEPGHVRLLWGTLIFFGRLESMTTQYTLFKPTGAPLRAKVGLSFVGSMSKQESRLVADRSSPDLSHRVIVREGDTLPLLCSRFYGDPSYYIKVARFNRLVAFRRLVPGTQLHFPPLE